MSELTAYDIFTIYFDFFEDLKKFKGNSDGFMGLSEYLLFRYLYNYLGGSFKPVLLKSVYIFESQEKNYMIGQNIPLYIDSKTFKPDIIVYKDNEPVLVIEIKIYLTNGMKSLERDINKLKHIHSQYNNATCLFICFCRISEKGKIYKFLMDEVKSNNWLNYLILEENKQNLKEFFEKIL